MNVDSNIQYITKIKGCIYQCYLMGKKKNNEQLYFYELTLTQINKYCNKWNLIVKLLRIISNN